jgi:cytochrome o ubiquinol oxidase subunit 1
VVALAGALVILAGIALTVLQLIVSVRQRDQRRDLSGDPWDGRSLEWSTASPPPPWNYATLPQVNGLDAFWQAKHPDEPGDAPFSRPVRMPAEMKVPRPSALGFVLAFCAVPTGFALVWHINWLAVGGVLTITAVLLRHAWRTEHEVAIPLSAAAVGTPGASR